MPSFFYKGRYDREMFTTENTLNEVIEGTKDPKIKAYFSLGMPSEFFDLVPEELKGCPLAEIKERYTMPWGMPYPAEEMAATANFAENIVRQEKYGVFSLWGREDSVPDPLENGKSSVFLLTLHKEQASAPEEKKPAVILCPGGGYETLSFIGEGISMAERLEKEGYFPFVLRYRLSPNRYPASQEDLALAVKFVRANAERFGIDPHRLMLMGSSAGGHLCASTAALVDEIDRALTTELEETMPEAAEKYRGISIRPDSLCLNYAVISFGKESHMGSIQALTGGQDALREKLSVEKQVSDGFPKTFLWACEDDQLVPVSNTTRMGDALREKGVPFKMMIYPTGGHGCGLAAGTSAEGWFDEMIKFMKEK